MIPIPESIDPDNGSEIGGTNVTITGKYFGSNSTDLISVTIAEIPCHFNYISSTLIFCITGPKQDGGKGNVVIQTVAGESVNELKYTYNYAPFVVSAVPDNGPIDGNTVVNITGKHFGESKDELISVSLAGILCKKFEWVNGKNILCTSGEVPSGLPVRGVIEVVTSGGGSGSSELKLRQDDVFYQYNPTPLVTSLSPNNGSYLGGTNITIQGFNLGKSIKDLVDIRVSGIICEKVTASMDYNGLTYYCITGPVPLPPNAIPTPVNGQVVVTTISGGRGDRHHQGKTNSFYTYNPPPYIIEVSPQYAFAMTPTKLKIQGKWLGQSASDVKEVLIAGRPCNFEYKTNSWLACMTPVVGIPLEGFIEITTKSGGTSHSNFTFNFLPQCEIYRNKKMCNQYSCQWCEASSSCVDKEQPCPSSCFLYTMKDACQELYEDPNHPCLWCPSTSSCLEYSFKTNNGQKSISSDCPQSCSLSPSSNFSCGSLIILFLWVILFLVLIFGFWLIIYFINKDEQFSASLKRLTTRLHPSNVFKKRRSYSEEPLLDSNETLNESNERTFRQNHLTAISDAIGFKKKDPKSNILNLPSPFSKLRQSLSVEENEEYTSLNPTDEEISARKIFQNYNKSGRSSIANYKMTEDSKKRKSISGNSARWKGGESPDASLLSMLVEQQNQK